MASKSSGPPKGPQKPETDQSGTKKPTPMLDLKATEVKESRPTDTASDDAKGGAGTPGAAGSPASGSASRPEDKAAAKTSATTPSSAKPSEPAAGTASTASGAASGAASKPASGPSATGSTGPSSGGGASSSGRPSSSGGPSSGGGASGTGSSKGLAGSANAPKPSAAKKSGGGIGATFTHLVAALVGGAVVLFGAAPIEKNLGFKVLPPAEIPAEMTSRLAALERAAAKDPAADLAKLRGDVAAIAKRVDDLATVNDRVASLAAEQKKLAETVAATPGGTAGAPADAETIAAIDQRIVKLEETLKTLAGATGPDGDKNALAKLATVAGKLTDLERTVNNQLEALRKSVMTELENRVAKTAEASAAAQAGTERIDRELAVVKTNAARLAQRAETLKAANDRLATLVRAAQEQTATIQAELDGLKGDVLQQFKKVARPQDVTTAIEPISSRLAKLDTRLETIVGREEVRKANAQRIVLALELGNLKRALERGGKFAAELAAVRKVAGANVDLGALEKFKSTGVPAAGELTSEFRTLAFKAINAEDRKPDSSVIDRLVSGAKSIVRVRRTRFASDDKSTEAIVARIEARLKQGDLSGALEHAKALSNEARAPLADWLDRLAARGDVDRAIAALESQLKASIGGTSAKPAKTGTKG